MLRYAANASHSTLRSTQKPELRHVDVVTISAARKRVVKVCSSSEVVEVPRVAVVEDAKTPIAHGSTDADVTSDTGRATSFSTSSSSVEAESRVTGGRNLNTFEASADDEQEQARRKKQRPLIPIVPLDVLADAFFGEPKVKPELKRLFQLTEDLGNSPRLYTPDVASPAGSPAPSTLPLLVYLPGMDGTGLAAYRQFSSLKSRFDLRALFIPPDDRTSFEALVQSVKGLLLAELSGADASRPVYLLGESFGGLLALALAQECSAVDRVVLVNPATSFAESPWPLLGPALTSLPPQLYNALPIALSPILANPLAMAMHGVSSSDPLARQVSDTAYGLIDLLTELNALRLTLPPATLAWRLQLLQEGAKFVNSGNFLQKVRQRVLLLVGQLDLVIPSNSEGPRLQQLMQRCRLRVLPLRAHAMLQEAGLSLVDIVEEEGFYQRTRILSTSGSSSSGSDSNEPDPLGPGTYEVPGGGANFGIAAPLQLPTRRELDIALDDGGLTLLRRLVSPVFFSTDAVTGRVERGLGAIPDGRPLLFVGNHQLFAPDMPLMIAQFLKERNMLLRGLAHPVALEGMSSSDDEESGSSDSRAGASAFGSFLKTFGAVPVSGTNMYKLLSQNEAVLLYPGGAREANKRRGEKYKLLWPKRAEFVRMACRFGATIIPFAAIGAEDSINIVRDSQEMLEVPLLGEFLRSRASKQTIPAARRGVNAVQEEDSDELAETFMQPLISPNVPARYYYIFRQPITTDPSMANDKAVAGQLYSQVKGEVEAGISYLLRKRLVDPYAEFGPRLLYEAPWQSGAERQAPTFEP